MQIVIDIPEGTYLYTKETIFVQNEGVIEIQTNGGTKESLMLFDIYTLFNIINAIKHCTPLPEDATNGDIFKAMFSNLTIYENRDNKDYPYVDVIIGEHDSTCYPKDWWDKQYKRGGEDGDSD